MEVSSYIMPTPPPAVAASAYPLPLKAPLWQQAGCTDTVPVTSAVGQVPFKGATAARRSYSPVGHHLSNVSANALQHQAVGLDQRTGSALIPATIMRKAVDVDNQQSGKSLV